jgi:hypothetical protein
MSWICQNSLPQRGLAKCLAERVAYAYRRRINGEKLEFEKSKADPMKIRKGPIHGYSGLLAEENSHTRQVQGKRSIRISNVTYSGSQADISDCWERKHELDGVVNKT